MKTGGVEKVKCQTAFGNNAGLEEIFTCLFMEWGYVLDKNSNTRKIKNRKIKLKCGYECFNVVRGWRKAEDMPTCLPL